MVASTSSVTNSAATCASNTDPRSALVLIETSNKDNGLTMPTRFPADGYVRPMYGRLQSQRAASFRQRLGRVPSNKRNVIAAGEAGQITSADALLGCAK